jgi:UDP-2-acetamido-2,6-beta-L-arabino-hexul-4-ose reductase
MNIEILVTGARGFIGKNLVVALERGEGTDVFPFDLDLPVADLERGLAQGDVVFHLAGVNRPGSEEEFEKGNVDPLRDILSRLERNGRRPLLVLASSTQALRDNPYGRSKRKAEELLLDYASRTGTPARIFRLPGVFGKWCRPNYNSVVATFCHSIARGLPIEISDPAATVELVHVDDVVLAFLGLLKGGVEGADFATVQPVFKTTLGELAGLLTDFHATRKILEVKDLSDPFHRRLFGTFVSYQPSDALAYALPVRSDVRGELAEFLKAGGHGQIFLSRTRPGITRGGHYHDLKVEKFLVVEGQAVIRFRHILTDERAEFAVSGTGLEVVDIPPGWTHSIENTGTSDLVTLFWSSEVHDPDRPDTFRAEVQK